MATYYVRISGSDSNAGTSAGAAWRTIGKALGASGIASGDTCYIGSGVYREVVTVAMASATAETSIIGDVDGAQTGDAGEVIWTSFLNGWNDTPSSSDVCNLAGRDFLTFRNLTLIAGASANCIDGSTATATNIKLDTCYISGFGAVPIIHTSAFGIASNWTIQNCVIFNPSGGAISPTLTTGVGSDYDVNFQITDSLLMAGSVVVNVTNSGTSANKGGGVDIARCTIFGTVGMFTTASQISTTVPCTVTDSLILTQTTMMNAGTAGQITDLGGNVGTATYTNITAHATSKTATEDFPSQALSLGHEWMWGMPTRRAFSPLFPGSLGRGHIGSATTDIEGRNRPEGTGRVILSGTATAGSSTTITDSGKTWGTNEHTGRILCTTGGTGSGQVKRIASNTATVLTPDTVWATTPDSTTTYIIYEGPPALTAKATSGSTTTFVVSSAAWSTNKWAGYSLEITAGTNSGNTRTIVSNTGTTLTVAAFGSAIDSTSVGSIYWPGASLTSASGKHAGAFELHDTAAKETTTTDAGSVGLVINGPGSHEFLIPVDASSTTISIKMQYDANHGTTNKPQAILLANGEIGVSSETKTMTSGSGTWDTLTFSAFTPTAKGVVTVRLVSRSDTPYGKAFADTWTVT